MVKRGLALSAAAFLMAGCLGPNYERVANDLRAKNQKLQQELEREQQQVRDMNATVAVLSEQLDAKTPRVETLSKGRLEEIFTVDRVSLQSNLELWDSNNDGKPDSFRVFVRPLCSDGAILPATGKLTIEAFDLALQDRSQRIGQWTFSPGDLKNKWFSAFGLNHFALTCPWTQPPAHTELTFKVHFVDALTGHAFEDQKLIRVPGLAAATQTASAR